MKVAFDTSVLVAALVEDHPQHARAAIWLRTPRGYTRIASAHAFAETWAVLSAMPMEPPISGQVARTALERLGRTITFIPPRQKTYLGAVARCAALGLRSGAVHDALHFVAAEDEKADLFLTFNERDFARLVETGSPRVVVPPDPPRVSV